MGSCSEFIKYRRKKVFEFFQKCKVTNLIKDYEKVLFFVGSGRTGSTLIGQLINYHPECLIGNEYNIARKVIEESKSFEKEILKMSISAYKNFNNGFSTKTTNQFQKKWKNLTTLSNEKIFLKRDIKLVGDKIGGRLNNIYVKYPNELTSMFNQINNLFFLFVIRNPVNAAKSFLKSHPHEVKTYDEAIEKVLYNYSIAYKIIQNISANCLIVNYEELQKEPEKVLKQIFTWLKLSISDEWIKKIVTKIDRNISKNELSQLEKEKTTELLEKYNLNDIQKMYNL